MNIYSPLIIGSKSLLIVLLLSFTFCNAFAQESNGQEGLIVIGAAIAAGLAFFSAGIGLGMAGAAAIGAVAEKPEMFSLTFVYIVFIEAIAVYGLVLAFMILGRL
jgi:V/A-type H+-transporting ATPase subunit K